ncbi:stage II sporulation protein P [Sporosarcina sp. ACRSL]|uniref:stage II sporulation protein P n=1 Tax=Sporosarcina sp. ACRSL TaxID=2918215 RepID=UPI001EF5932E|nr:stage II sporulation protein P [Sporosarcina sp. ACRSL]MCG7345080.1 stage II sporulation protein P [Sporosarcina sp. ACRSL]
MKKNFQIWTVIVFVLFLFPVIIQLIPEESKISNSKIIKENALIVYASNVVEEEKTEPEPEPEPEVIEEPETTAGKVLLYFTHSHEAYEPMTKAADGKIAVSHQHQTENVMKMGEKLKSLLQINGVETEMLEVDNMKELAKKNLPYYRAYDAIRPYVKNRLSEKEYDLIIDIHRDAVGREKTTLVHGGEKYAKVAFVVGMDHPGYKNNEMMTNRLKTVMENRIPGITRDVIPKGGAGVDGKYNQDLHPNIILVELGGVGNSEDELNRTVAIIAESVSELLNEVNEAEEK